MTTKTSRAPSPPNVPGETDGIFEKNLDLAFDMIRDAIDDASLLDEIPDGVTLILLPADDPEVTAANLEIGVAAIRRGEDVLFRHVHTASPTAS